MIPDWRDGLFEFGQPQQDGRTVTFPFDHLFLVGPRGRIPAFGACPVRLKNRNACSCALHSPGRHGLARSQQQGAIKYNHASSLTGQGFHKVAPWFILEPSAAQLRVRRQSSGFNFRSRAMGSSDASSAARSSSVVGIFSILGLVQGLRLFGASSSAGRLISYSRAGGAHSG